MDINEWNIVRNKLKTIIAEATGSYINDDLIIRKNRGIPHQVSLPKGMMGIYTFSYNGQYLKIGKVGSKSAARFVSPHYDPKSSNSNLAKSILKDPDMQNIIDHDDLKTWIKNNTDRVDLLIDASLGTFVLNLVEAALHCMYKPKYEGFESQNNK